MSPKLPRITAIELLRALGRDGWYESRGKGGHRKLRHPKKVGSVVVPVHSGETIKPKTLETILEQAGLTVERLRKLL